MMSKVRTKAGDARSPGHEELELMTSKDRARVKEAPKVWRVMSSYQILLLGIGSTQGLC